MSKIALFFYTLAGAANILSAIIDQHLLRALSKPLLMPALMLFVLSQKHVLHRNKLIFILFFAWFGDMFLLIPGSNPWYFQLGLGAFLIMQIAYIRIFLSQGFSGIFVLKQWISWPIIPVLIYVIGFLTFLIPYISQALIFPVGIYAIALGAMLFSAFLRKQDSTYFLVLVGALFFVISDSILAYAKFYSPFFGNSIYVMSNYILAQLLLILGLCNLQFKKFTK